MGTNDGFCGKFQWKFLLIKKECEKNICEIRYLLFILFLFLFCITKNNSSSMCCVYYFFLCDFIKTKKLYKFSMEKNNNNVQSFNHLFLLCSLFYENDIYYIINVRYSFLFPIISTFPFL